MSLWDVCIRRPVFTTMLVAAPLVLGLVSYTRLGVELFPNVDLPMVTVTTTLRGASVEEMETQVTKPIEEIVNTISGIDELRSTTKEGISQVTIQFVLEKSGAVAAQEVDAKVRTILAELPVGTDPPLIDKFDLDASPIMTIAVSGRRDPREVTEIAKKRIKEDLETLPGVGAVTIVGGRQRAIQVIIDPDRLLKYGDLSIEDVRDALVKENQEQPGGRVDRGLREEVLRVMGRVRQPADFEKLIIANRNGQPVRLEDIGRVEDTFEEPRGTSRLWARARSAAGSPGDVAVSLVVRKQSGTNTVQVADALLERLAEILPLLPPDIEAEVVRDQSRFIRRSMEEVTRHLLLAAVLVGLTILLFIRDLRTTIIATLAIPASIVVTFTFMQFMGFTLNNITMLGLILAVGIVIDDAVVVHENIFRHMEEHGRSAMEAAGTATREIALAVAATTLSLLVIFIPVAFMSGRVGRFFSSFGMVVGFSVLTSMLISFTMTPMLCSRFLKLEGKKRTSKEGRIWTAIERSYLRVLSGSLERRWVVILLTAGVLASTPLIFRAVGKDFIPRDDQSELEVVITLPEGYSLERADRTCAEIEGKLHRLRGVTHTLATIGDTTGRVTRGQGEVTACTIYVRLVDISERDYSQFDVMADARAMLADYPDLRSTVQDVSAFQGTGFRHVMVDLNLRGPDMDKLREFSGGIAGWMRAQGHYVDVDTSLTLQKPEMRIFPDRERASELGVTVEDISLAANVLVGGVPVSKYKEHDEMYDVWLRAEGLARMDWPTISRLAVRSERNGGGLGLVTLGQVARYESALGPSTIDRFSRQRQVVIAANLDGKALGDAVVELSRHIESLNLPAEYRYEFIGRAKTLAEATLNFIIAFALSFLFMYMILAGQFESFLHPITILLALPLTIPFALLSLLFLDTNLDIYAMFGLFMLFGIVKKNGILQVDYTNVLRQRGMPLREAILEANHTRLRPILMTTVMLLAAMLPMALGTGPGAAARASMAKVILGGQSLSLALTLIVTPIVYSLWEDLRGAVARRRKARAVLETSPTPA